MIALQYDVLDVSMIEESVQSSSNGAVLVFVGRTRDLFEGKRVLELQYEAYETMAIKEMKHIQQEIEQKWSGSQVSIVHRLGTVEVAQASVVIAVSAPHRGECYEASRFAIDMLKNRVPIWKKEIFQDGSIWKANQ